MAMLFGAIFTILLLPAYGQQEVDPTWYDPWAAPTTAVVHPSQPPGGRSFFSTAGSHSPVSTGGQVCVADSGRREVSREGHTTRPKPS